MHKSMYMMLQTHDTQASPFIKRVVGKTQFLEESRRTLPADIDFHRSLTYIEPFVGGGVVLFWIMQQYPNIEHTAINNASPELICTYCVIETDVEALTSEFATLQKEYLTLDTDSRKEYFLDKRTLFNTKSTVPATTSQFKQYNYIFYSEEGHCISPALNNVEDFHVLGIEKGHNHKHALSSLLKGNDWITDNYFSIEKIESKRLFC